jgi:DNA topoisomerase-1
MADKLVIVESSAKAKTIAKYLGKGFQVQASKGHIRDLPENELGVETEKDFEAKWVIMPDSVKIVAALRKASAKAQEVYLAPDPDREGEAIAWHLVAALDLPEDKTRRVTFNEITRSAVRAAFEHPREIDEELVDAYKARRILDRLVGYKLSPLISKQIVRGLSAGRVQSVALRLIVDRERERQAFVPEEYWEIVASLSPQGEDHPFEAKLAKLDGEAAKVGNAQAAEGLVERLKQAAWRVASIDERDTSSKPPPPFRTSTMQQAASNRLGYTAERTMRLAQQLYEGIEIGAEAVGLITYMRTDSVQVAAQALDAVREMIPSTYGAQYLPEKLNFYKDPRGAQAAHEGVRPTDVTRTPEAMRAYLNDNQWKLYDLIWRRFVASQMTPARYHTTTVGIEAGPALFEAKGRRTVFDGYMQVLRPKEEGDQELPPVEVGQALELRELTPSQHFTQPPPLYNEASLVKELEKQGIGRPSTYAPTIAVLVRRNYVRRERRAFRPTELGMTVCDMLVANFPREMDVGFTSHMEEELDEIEAGKRGWRSTLHEFWDEFSAALERAQGGMKAPARAQEREDLGACPDCGRPLEIKHSRKGSKFIGCTGFPECTYTASLRKEGPQPEESGHKCPKCGSPMLVRTSKRGRPYLSCSAYPECRNVMGLDKEGNPVELAPRVQTGFSCPRCHAEMHLQSGDGGGQLVCGNCRNRQPLLSVAEALQKTELPTDEPLGYCEKCNAPMAVKFSRNGMFLGCSNYPECKNTAQLSKERLPGPQPTQEVCEKCGRPLVVRWGQYGRFLACSGFPRCRNSWKLPARLKECPREGCGGRLLRKASADGPYYGCTRYPECDYREAIDEAAEEKAAAKKQASKKPAAKGPRRRTAKK